jgi:hypothetical protein
MKPRNKSENIIGHWSAQKFVSRAFSGLVALWPASSREWALAMQSELHEIESSRESLRWLAGGFMSLMKAWWNEIVYGWRGDEAKPRVVRMPGPAPVMIAVIALAAFFLWPAAHEGFSAFLQTWPTSPRGYFAGTMQDLEAKAKAEHDAKTLVFVSQWAPSPEAAQMLDEAVSLDPSLTWAYVEAAGASTGYHDIAQAHGWMKKFEAWDPDNAAPYLVAASARANEIGAESGWQPSTEKKINDPEWRSEMEKAFAAPRLDYYTDRATKLHQTVLREHNLRAPAMVGARMGQFFRFGLWESKLYADVLLGQAKEAEIKGDTATASRLAWSVVEFGERVRQNVTSEIGRWQADAILLPAYDFLQPIEAAEGHAGVAGTLSIQKAALLQRKAALRMPHMPWDERSLDPAGVSLQAGGSGAILFGCAVIFAMVYLVAGRIWPELRRSRVYSWACNCGRFAPVGMILSVWLLILAYAPFLGAVNAYVAGAKDAPTVPELNTMAAPFYQLPGRFLGPMNQGQDRVYFWTGLLLAVFIAGALVLIRSAFRTRAPRVTTA